MSGFSFTRDAARDVPIEGLESNVPCRRHNSALSDIDTEAAAFFRAFRSMRRRLAAAESYTVLFNGHGIERWLLKAACAIAAGGTSPDLPGKGWRPPLAWLDVLYFRTSIQPPAGLTYWAAEGATLEGSDDEIAFGLALVDGEVHGFGISFAGFNFVLAMTERALAITGDGDGKRRLYRPNGFEMTAVHTGAHAAVVFGWQGPRCGEAVRLQWRS